MRNITCCWPGEKNQNSKYCFYWIYHFHTIVELKNCKLTYLLFIPFIRMWLHESRMPVCLTQCCAQTRRAAWPVFIEWMASRFISKVEICPWSHSVVMITWVNKSKVVLNKCLLSPGSRPTPKFYKIEFRVSCLWSGCCPPSGNFWNYRYSALEVLTQYWAPRPANPFKSGKHMSRTPDQNS
jgi:hypothetical protein